MCVNNNMKYYHTFIRKNITSFAIVLYFICFVVIYYSKPSIMFNEDGSVKEFGVGYRKKTVVPLWFALIIISVLSYMSIQYYLLLSN